MQSCPFRPSVSIDSSLLHRREGPIDERLHNEWQRKLVEREKVGTCSSARHSDMMFFWPHNEWQQKLVERERVENGLVRARNPLI